MNSPQPPVEDHLVSHRQLQVRRIEQICQLLLVCLPFMALTNIQVERRHVLLMIVSGWLLVGVSLWLSRIGRHDPARQFLILSMFALASAAMWFDQGPYNGVLLGYAAILVIAGMLARMRLLFVLLLLMLVWLGWLNYAEISGLRSFEVQPLGLRRFVNSAVFLSVIACTVWWLASDLRSLLARLRAENRRVRESEVSLAYQAQHDALTGLPNRLLARDRLEQALQQAHRAGRQVALMYLDLDNFKTVNDSFGHAQGDELLREVAARLRASVRETDTVCRLGGDEFLLVLAELEHSEGAVQVARKIQANLSAPLQLGEVTLNCSCSIGIALYPGDGDCFASLSQHADMAMYEAKAAGRRTFRFFDAQMNASQAAQMQLDVGLRSALQHEQFVLHYQPVVDLQTGQLRGAEALLRWNSPEQGLRGPETFIGYAERSGLIVEIGEWVIDQACAQLAAWQAQGLPRLVLAVNLSPVQFRRGNLDRVVSTALQRHGVPPSCLELELTESVLLQDSRDFAELLTRLKRLGVSLSIDDFGTGYSNLSYLQRFKVDRLKIDRSFVGSLSSDHSARAIVSAIAGMADSLGLQTTAEGIEDREVLALLSQLGCSQGQGYLFARPLPASAFIEFARTQARPPV